MNAWLPPGTWRPEQNEPLIPIRMKVGKHREIYKQTGIKKIIMARVGEAGETSVKEGLLETKYSSLNHSRGLLQAPNPSTLATLPGDKHLPKCLLAQNDKPSCPLANYSFPGGWEGPGSRASVLGKGKLQGALLCPQQLTGQRNCPEGLGQEGQEMGTFLSGDRKAAGEKQGCPEGRCG